MRSVAWHFWRAVALLCCLCSCAEAGSLLPANLTDCDASCQALQKAGLDAFYDSLNGDYWYDNLQWKDKTVAQSRVFPDTGPWGYLSDYNLSKARVPIATHCFWYGVICCSPIIGPNNDPANSTNAITLPSGLGSIPCSVPGAVVALFQFPNNNTGMIPGYFYQTVGPTLEVIVVTGGSVHGTISPEVANLQSLSFMDFSNNQITGSIPGILFELPTLRKLSLVGNQLTGTLPPLIYQTNPYLQILDVSRNNITGPLPLDYLAGRDQMTFAVAYNQMTGSILSNEAAYLVLQSGKSSIYDAYIQDYQQLNLYLQGNSFTGTISPAWIQLQSLEDFDISTNQLTGNLNSISYLVYLTRFKCANNKLVGPLPQVTLGQTSIQELDFRNNSLTGAVPPSYATQVLLNSFQIANNNLSGSLPANFDGLRYLSTLNVEDSGLTHGNYKNSRGENLPEFLQFDRSLNVYSGVRNFPELQCLSLTSSIKALESIVVSPEYFGFQDCKCNGGFQLRNTTDVVQGSKLACVRVEDVNRTVVVVAVTTAVVVLAALLAMAVLLKNNLQEFAERLRKRAGPPTGAGRAYTIFESDVEGSTELWEWNPEVMDKAIDVHDRVMRGLLRQYYGFEVTTEGDAFQFVFHHAADAVAYATAAQQALLTAKWPPELEQHYRTRTRYTTDTCSSEDAQLGHTQAIDADGLDFSSESRPLSDVMFCGLAVRMVIASGHVERCQSHAVSNRVEYQGEVPKLAHVIGEAPQGGQVLIDAACYAEVSNLLADIARRIPSRPDYDALASLQLRARSKLKLSRCLSFSARLSGRRSAWSLVGALLPEEPGDRTEASIPGSPVGRIEAGSEEPNRGSLEGQSKRVHVADATASNLLEATSNSFWTSMFRVTKKDGAHEDESSAIMVMDMGQHCFKDWPEPQKLIQVLVPGVEERARMFLPLATSSQISPGYFDAPGADIAPLRTVQPVAPLLPDVTLVFCSIEKLKEMKEKDTDAASSALLIYLACVRKLLRRCNGYECQEADGGFMLAFKSPVEAILFCLMVQEELVNEVWSDGTLQLGPCRPLHGPGNEVLFLGPRIKMGIYEGRPNRICPHTTTGRADYFGMLVNRAARYCSAVAHGGQIMAPIELVEKVITAWTGLPCPPLDSLEGPAFLAEAQMPLPGRSDEVLSRELPAPGLSRSGARNSGGSPRYERKMTKTVWSTWSQLRPTEKLPRHNSSSPVNTDVRIDVDPDLEDTMAKPLELAEAAQEAAKARSTRASRSSRTTADLAEGEQGKRRLSGMRVWVKRISSFGKDATLPEADSARELETANPLLPQAAAAKKRSFAAGTRPALGNLPPVARLSALGSSRPSRGSLTRLPEGDGPPPDTVPSGGEAEATEDDESSEEENLEVEAGVPLLPWNILVTWPPEGTALKKKRRRPTVNIPQLTMPQQESSSQQESSGMKHTESASGQPAAAEQISQPLSTSCSSSSPAGRRLEAPAPHGGQSNTYWKSLHIDLGATLSTVQSQQLSVANSLDTKFLSSSLRQGVIVTPLAAAVGEVHHRSSARKIGWPNPGDSLTAMAGPKLSNAGLARNLTASAATMRGLQMVEFHHSGSYRLKGVAGVQTVMQINSIAFANRALFVSDKAASGKAEKVAPGKGLVYTITLLPP